MAGCFEPDDSDERYFSVRKIKKEKKMESEQKVPVFRVPKCSYPKCYADGKVAVSGSPFCRKHAEWADFFLWIATQIKMKDPNITKSGLVIPK